MIYIGILKAWHLASYTASVQLTVSATYFDSVPVARNIAPGEMVAGRHVIMVVPDQNPADAVVVGEIHTMTDKKTAPASSEGPQTQFRSGLPRVARAVTRPIITIMMAAVVAQVVIEGITPPDWFIHGIAMPVILSWFGERAVRRFKGEE
ncbi:MAG: hypothetical protein ACNA7X_04325 [Dehalococcoidia bacterium]